MNIQKPISVLLLDTQRELYNSLFTAFNNLKIEIDYHPNAIRLLSFTENEKRKYSAILINDEVADYEEAIEHFSLRFPDIEIMLFGTILPKKEPDDVFRFFKKPIDSLVVAINVQSAARKNYISDRKRRALQILHDTGKFIIDSNDQDKIIRKIVESASQIMESSKRNGHFSHLALLENRDNGRYLVFHEVHHSQDIWELLRTALEEDCAISVDVPEYNQKIGLIGRALIDNKTQNNGDVRKDPNYIYLHEQVNSQLAIPVRVKTNIVGVLSVEHPDLFAFDEDDENTLEALVALLEVAIDKVKLYDKERRQTKALKVIQEIGQEIDNISLTRDDLFKLTAVKAYRLMVNLKGEGYHTHLALKEGRVLQFHAKHNSEEIFTRITRALPNGIIDLDDPPMGKRGVIGRAVESETIQCVNNVQDDPDYIKFDERINSQLAVPIFDSDQVIGAINIEHTKKNAFDKKDEENLQLLVSYLENGITKVDLYREISTRAEQLETIYTLSQEIAKRASLDGTLRKITRLALQSINRPVGNTQVFCHVRLFENEKLLLKSISPSTMLSLHNIVQEIDVTGQITKRGISGYAFYTGEIQNIGNVHLNEHYICISNAINSQLSVPIIFEDTPLGVISIESYRNGEFSADEVSKIQLFSKMSAIAIVNAKFLDANNIQLINSQKDVKYLIWVVALFTGLFALIALRVIPPESPLFGIPILLIPFLVDSVTLIKIIYSRHKNKEKISRINFDVL